MHSNRKIFIAGAALLGIWFAFYWNHFSTLLSHWDTRDYSYCYIIPFLFIYFVYDRKDNLPQVVGSKVWPGYIILIFTGLLYLIGRMGSLETFIYFSMWTALLSLIFLFLGVNTIKKLAFSFFMLLFAIPAPPFITNLLTFKLRILSSIMAVEIFDVLNVPVFREGNIIDMGFSRLEIVDACSGLRYVVPTLITSLVIGYMFHKNIYKRILLVILSIPVALCSNSLRIVIVGLTAKYVSLDLIEGSFHDLTGWGVFVVSVAILLFCSYVLNKFLEDKENDNVGNDKKIGKEIIFKRKKILFGNLILVITFFSLLFISEKYLLQAQITPVNKPYLSFPMQIGTWEGTRITLDSGILDRLWADDYVQGKYIHKGTGNVLYLLIPYYRFQTTQHTAHAPTSCLLGSGYSIVNKKKLSPEADRNFPVAQIVLNKSGSTLLANFWFEQRGRHITNEYLNKLYLIWDSLKLQRTDGALVRVEMYIKDGQTIPEAQDLLDQFLVKLKKVLDVYVPGENYQNKNGLE